MADSNPLNYDDKKAIITIMRKAGSEGCKVCTVHNKLFLMVIGRPQWKTQRFMALVGKKEKRGNDHFYVLDETEAAKQLTHAEGAVQKVKHPEAAQGTLW